MYCKLENIRENFIVANSDKRHICDIKNLQIGYDLTISVNDRRLHEIARILFLRNFAYVKFCKNKTLAKISQFTVIIVQDLP